MSPTYAVPSAATIMSLIEPRARPGQVAVLDERAVVLTAQQLAGLHRDDEQAAIGQPAEPGRLVVRDLGDDGRRRRRRCSQSTAWPCMSLNHSAPSCQRGPSPNASPVMIVRGAAMVTASPELGVHDRRGSGSTRRGGHVGAGRRELVDAVEHVGTEHDVGRTELVLELAHGARSDDCGRDRRVLQHEREREIDQARSPRRSPASRAPRPGRACAGWWGFGLVQRGCCSRGARRASRRDLARRAGTCRSASRR